MYTVVWYILSLFLNLINGIYLQQQSWRIEQNILSGKISRTLPSHDRRLRWPYYITELTEHKTLACKNFHKPSFDDNPNERFFFRIQVDSAFVQGFQVMDTQVSFNIDNRSCSSTPPSRQHCALNWSHLPLCYMPLLSFVIIIRYIIRYDIELMA
jgi:hypothetical protein